MYLARAGVREALAVVPDNSNDEAVVAYLRQYRERMSTFERFEGMIRGAPPAAASGAAAGAVGGRPSSGVLG